jgi:branched-chain amino acid transport system ATP-binding protein
MNNSTLLKVNKVHKQFGGVAAVFNVSFVLRLGQIKAVIGPNGAGKTTIFNLVTGLLPVTAGEIHFKERRITKARPHKIAALGISRTFQNIQLFGNMTVGENVMVGRHRHTRAGLVASGLRLPGTKKEEQAIQTSAQEKLNLVGLAARASWMANALSLGEQRLLEIARALATEPQLLLLDEPAAGLNTQETQNLSALIRKINQMGVTILLVEHHMSLVMEISDEVMVLNYGEKIAEGSPAEIQKNPQVVAAYLGDDWEYARD